MIPNSLPNTCLPKLRAVVLPALAALCLLGGSARATSGDGYIPVDPHAPVCLGCLSIRVGLPRIEIGPTSNLADAHWSEVQMSVGSFRGFTSNASSYLLRGGAVWSFGGPLASVLHPGPAGSYDSCGQWLQDVQRAGDTWFGLVHDETDCNYAIGQTHKSMSLAVSRDNGLTWQDQGLIITGNSPPQVGKITGEGDCGAINGQDGYYYAYCSNQIDNAIIAARAPVSDPGPGHWLKYYDGAWSQPGLGGNATNLGSELNTGAARWKTTGMTILLGSNANGPALFFSTDHVRFTALAAPLVLGNTTAWTRPSPNELIAYDDLIDANDGSSQLGNSWYLVYTYLQPNQTFSQRYIVFRPVTVSIQPSAVSPQVGVQLARWWNPVLQDRWTTTAPVPGNYLAYRLDATLGFVMTAPDREKPTVELEDCVLQSGAHPDHLLTASGLCEKQGYQRLRVAGWVYQKPEPGTQPLYQCYSSADRSHFAATVADCDRVGSAQRLLGYDLMR
jgi:hypothetical protein